LQIFDSPYSNAFANAYAPNININVMIPMTILHARSARLAQYATMQVRMLKLKALSLKCVTLLAIKIKFSKL
jgi:hypothetical protein